MIAGMIGCGALMLTVVGILFKVNHGLIGKNSKKIEETNNVFHDVDKRLAVLTTILEIKWGKEIVEKAKKKNGDEVIG